MRWFHILAWLATPASALVSMYGDSILASNTPIQRDLETFGHIQIRNFAKIGAGMRDGWVQSIPSLYEENKDPVPNTIILDGGGNDVNAVRQDCLEMTQTCNDTIAQIADLVDSLMRQMKRDGVRNIVYVGFYYVNGFERAVDHGNEKIQTFCSWANHCYFVDLRPVPVRVGWDGMHPVETSYHDISREIWQTMVQHNVSLVA